MSVSLLFSQEALKDSFTCDDLVTDYVCVCLQLGEALQTSTQAAAELSLQQKLRQDSEVRVEELEESLLEKEQELQRQEVLITRLQGEVRLHRYSVLTQHNVFHFCPSVAVFFQGHRNCLFLEYAPCGHFPKPTMKTCPL